MASVRVLRCALILFTSLLFDPNLIIVTGKKVINFSPAEMSRSEVIGYFKTVYQTKVSSGDKANEELYLTDGFLEDLYHGIDNLLSRKYFVRYLLKTKNITDKSDGKGGSLLSSYHGELNRRCSKSSVFNYTLPQILKQWDGDKTIIGNEIVAWHKENVKTPFTQLCNRFRGLTCQYKIAVSPEVDQGKLSEKSDNPTCQCAGDSSNVGFYKKQPGKKQFQPRDHYPTGCYVRPWKPCKFLSVDNVFPQYYNEWHKSMENQRRQLAQMVFPVGRTHRCKEGTYCMDLVPGLKDPICWCNGNSDDETCKTAFNAKGKHTVPTGEALAVIRKKFMKKIIPVNDTMSPCTPAYNEKVLKISKGAGKNPLVTGVVDLMKEIALSMSGGHICDFRQNLFCDPNSRMCTGNLDCDPGKINLGMGVCASDNGFPCQSNEECVEHAKCRHVKGTETSACVCESGYGSMCRFEKPSFFARNFLPVLSGYVGQQFIEHQVLLNKFLEAWEDNMKQKVGEICDPIADGPSLEAIAYFGNLQAYDNETGEILMQKVKEAIKDGQRLCYYNKFLRCDRDKLKCVPLLGDRLVPTPPTGDPDALAKITVEVDPGKQCRPTMPMIFEHMVGFMCTKGYVCKKSKGESTCEPDCNSVFAPKDICEAMARLKSIESRNFQVDPYESESSTLSHNETTPGMSETDSNMLDNGSGNNLESLMTRDEDKVLSQLRKKGSAANTMYSGADSPGGSTITSGSTYISGSTTAMSGNTIDSSGVSTTISGDTITSPEDTSVVSGDATNSGDLTTLSGDAATESGDIMTMTSDVDTIPGGSKPEPGDTDDTNILVSETTGSKTISTTTAEETENVEDPTPPPEIKKAAFFHFCRFNDTRVIYTDFEKKDICDSDMYLICVENVCDCLPTFTYSQSMDKCVIPIGERCAPDFVKIPSFMDETAYTCEYGECLPENIGDVCRPRSDEGLVIISAIESEVSASAAASNELGSDENNSQNVSPSGFLIPLTFTLLLIKQFKLY